MLMETAGLPLTGHQRFLLRLRETVPALNAMGFLDAGGVWHKGREDLPEAARTGLLQYESLQYNLLFDSPENRLPDFFTLKP